jgi:drug/metabolite transporter (DMT)-like permease
MMTKMVTKGLCCNLGGTGLTGFQIQPIAVLASFVAMYSFITIMGWWKFTHHFRLFGLKIPRPDRYTFLSGICLSGQIITTTLAYTFDGISIVFAMLLMRGGVLAMAPVVDLLVRKRKRTIYWPSWVAAGLSLVALVVAFSGKAGTAMTVIAAIDISIYLLGYFFRLFIMSSRAKSDDPAEKRGYFAEEQMVANVVLFVTLFIVGWTGAGTGMETIRGQIWTGFTDLPFQGFFLFIFMLGIFSWGTGVFGSLIYLDKRENTFTVPANRSASIIAGVIATYLLAFFYGQRYPSSESLAAAAIIIGAIAFLAYRQVVEKKLAKGSRTRKRITKVVEAESEA